MSEDNATEEIITDDSKGDVDVNQEGEQEEQELVVRMDSYYKINSINSLKNELGSND